LTNYGDVVSFAVETLIGCVRCFGRRSKMKLTKLYKDQGSGANGCPAVYIDDGGELVVQGRALDDSTFAELDDILPGESAVRIAPDVVIGAVARYTGRVGGES